ncbi:uncharacterized protein LOC143541009 [Bidens hawaiensis]|uniref:uncharacterized protein LOC143541009 n=1 Tax=Bidens hawaiensis TaxID=980011 RepID=UPI0040497F45
MSPALEDSSSSTQPSYFQNPNPSLHTDSGIFNTFDFDSSMAAARPSRKKPVKVKKHAVSSKHVNGTGKTIDFVFNLGNGDSVCNPSLGQTVNGEKQSVGESLDPNMLQFIIGSSDYVKSAKKMDSEEVRNAGNGSRSGNLKFDFSEIGAEKFGKPNGLEFVFGANANNGGLHVDESKSNGTEGIDGVMKANNFTTEADSVLASSLSSLNLGTGESGDAALLMNDNIKTQENNASDSNKSVNLEFAFAADHGDGLTDVNCQKEECKETVNNLFFDSKVDGLFHIGIENKSTLSCKGRRKVSKRMNNPKSEGAGACDGLKKQGINIDPVHDGNTSFVFGSRLGNATSDIPQSKAFDELKTSNIHDPTKNNNLSNNSCARSDASTLNQKTDEGRCCQNQLKTEAELAKETVPSSTIDFGFVPKAHHSEAPPTNEAGPTNNISFPSTNGVFGTSFTGFNTPDINLATSFTSDMFSGLGKKLDFSKTNSVGQRKLKKTKAKLRQQSRNHQQSGLNSSKEVPQSFEEASGYSPMDFSPYGGTTDTATAQVKKEDAVGTTEDLSANNFSSSSITSFADADVSARQQQQPHRKKYIIKSGQGVKFATPKVSRAHESTSGKPTKDSDQEICDKWRKRGNQAYKKGDLSEAEVCYSKGISSIQHTETPAFCIEPLLLCYSNRAAARMALGRLREGLKDCRTAAALDPTFVKANLRSANCHLLLGELEDASYNYSKCLESENIVCLDRRLAIEAADGLQKAQKVANHLKQSAELLQQKTYESATTALEIISDALSVSCYSEKLLNLKGEALLVLGKHKDVVQMCEQTLDSAEKNFATGSKLWRWNLMSKSYFHRGRLEMALEFIEKHEQLGPASDKSVDPKESFPLAVTIRELLHCKNAGNEAFQNVKHTEAIEHYSAAISKSMESHAFAAVCFCNRAAAHQALGEIIDAIGDCSTAIALDETYPKALSRRSTLWEMIRDYKHAADDLQRLISIYETYFGENSKKSNGSVKDLRRARRRLSSIEENSKKERSLDLYLILGIKPSDAAVEVKKAYRKAALRHHPDKAGQVIARAESGSDGQKWKAITESIRMDADKLFKMIGEAYAVLSDSTKRSKYDLEEEMWDDMNTPASSSSRRASDFYNSPFDTSNRRSSHYSSKPYGNSHYNYWEHSRRNYHYSYSRW